MSQSKAKQPKEKQAFSAVTMRIVLVVVLLLILALMSGGFYVAYSSLRTTAEEVAKYIADNEVEYVDIRFSDLPGIQQHFSIPAKTFTPELVAEGLAFDGSSVRGFQAINDGSLEFGNVFFGRGFRFGGCGHQAVK